MWPGQENPWPAQQQWPPQQQWPAQSDWPGQQQWPGQQPGPAQPGFAPPGFAPPGFAPPPPGQPGQPVPQPGPEQPWQQPAAQPGPEQQWQQPAAQPGPEQQWQQAEPWQQPGAQPGPEQQWQQAGPELWQQPGAQPPPDQVWHQPGAAEPWPPAGEQAPPDQVWQHAAPQQPWSSPEGQWPPAEQQKWTSQEGAEQPVSGAHAADAPISGEPISAVPTSGQPLEPDPLTSPTWPAEPHPTEPIPQSQFGPPQSGPPQSGPPPGASPGAPGPHDLSRPADTYSYRPAPDPAPDPAAERPPNEAPPTQPEWRTNPAAPTFDRSTAPPTAEEFAARRAHRPRPPEPTMGMPALIRRVTFGTVSPQLSKREIDYRDAVAKVRRNFGGLRQVTVVNPKGGAGKTVAVLMTAMTFGQNRGGYVLAWDNNETQGTLGMRSQQDYHVHTVRDVLRALPSFQQTSGKVGDLTPFVRSQGEAMFDVLASDESATAGEMLTADAFKNIREIVARFYKLIVVDTGNNVRAANWQAAIDATDQLVITMSARGDSAETAARMLDHLDQTGRHELVRRAVTVVAMAASRKDVDLEAIQRHFAARTRAVLLAPYEKLLDSGEPIRYGELSSRSRNAWLRIAAAIAEGL
ncbi:chromosome partitioning protein [Cryptosporangium sp. NPDC051539]|uniref:chromosome partitioning protein n=1 Tax=Cryptosporangium sp. NPDC051539 TaxID=3363962 RepID=UPI00379F45DD